MADDARATVNTVGWVLAALCTLLVALRVYARTMIVQKFGWDDGLMVIAWAMAITTTGMVTVGTTYGFAMHTYDIHDRHRLSEAVKWTWIPPAISLFSSLAAKIAVVAFLMRLLGRAAQLWHKIVLYGASVILVGANTFSWVVLFGYCSPREKAWKPWLEGSCMSPDILNFSGRAVSAYNAFMDLLCATFAIVLVSTLNMKKSTKLGLAVLMGGGIFGMVATIVKTVAMANIQNTDDMTWSWMPVAIWYLAEMHVIIMAGSVPMLRPIWSRWRGKDYSSSPKGTYDTDGSKQNRFMKFGSSRKTAPGQYTVALNDLDNEAEAATETGRRSNDNKSNGGSSVENILPKKPEQSATGFSPDENGIRVTNEVHVGYSHSERARIPSDGFNGGRTVDHHAFSRSES